MNKDIGRDKRLITFALNKKVPLDVRIRFGCVCLRLQTHTEINVSVWLCMEKCSCAGAMTIRAQWDFIAQKLSSNDDFVFVGCIREK